MILKISIHCLRLTLSLQESNIYYILVYVRENLGLCSCIIYFYTEVKWLLSYTAHYTGYNNEKQYIIHFVYWSVFCVKIQVDIEVEQEEDSHDVVGETFTDYVCDY